MWVYKKTLTVKKMLITFIVFNIFKNIMVTYLKMYEKPQRKFHVGNFIKSEEAPNILEETLYLSRKLCRCKK